MDHEDVMTWDFFPHYWCYVKPVDYITAQEGAKALIQY